MSRAEEIQQEVERVAELVTQKVNERIEADEGEPLHWTLNGLDHERIYLSVFSHHRMSYGRLAGVEPEVNVPELGHLSEHQIRDRVERAAEQGLIVKIKDGSLKVSFTSTKAKEIIDRQQREREMAKEALEERVERLREKTGIEIEFPRNVWSRGKVVGSTLEIDLGEFEEFVSRVVR